MEQQIPHKITSHAELKRRIAYLESIKERQEEVLKQNIHEVYKSLQPAELVKSAITNIRNDAEIGHDVVSLAGNAGIDLLVGKVFNKNNSIGGMIKSVIVGEVLRSVYNKNQEKIHDFVGNMTGKVMDFLHIQTKSKKEKEKEDQAEI